MNNGIAVFILLLALGMMALQVWFVVITVRFLRSGRRAFDHYSRQQEQPVAVRPADPAWAAAPGQRPHHQSGA